MNMDDQPAYSSELAVRDSATLPVFHAIVLFRLRVRECSFACTRRIVSDWFPWTASEHYRSIHESFYNQISQHKQQHFSSILVPMRFRIFVQRWKHNRQDDDRIIANQWHDIFVIPIVECTFGHLTNHISLMQTHN